MRIALGSLTLAMLSLCLEGRNILHGDGGAKVGKVRQELRVNLTEQKLAGQFYEVIPKIVNAKVMVNRNLSKYEKTDIEGNNLQISS